MRDRRTSAHLDRSSSTCCSVRLAKCELLVAAPLLFAAINDATTDAAYDTENGRAELILTDGSVSVIPLQQFGLFTRNIDVGYP